MTSDGMEKLIIALVSAAIGACLGWVGVAFGYLLERRRDRWQRRVAYQEKTLEPLHRLLGKIAYAILTCQRCEADYLTGTLDTGRRLELSQQLTNLNGIVRSTDFALVLSSVRHRKLKELVLDLDLALRRIPANADEPNLAFTAILRAQDVIEAIYALEEKLVVG